MSTDVATIEEMDRELMSLYKEEAEALLPVDMFNGYGKVERVGQAMGGTLKVRYDNEHHICNGVYNREAYIEAGAFVIGHKHRYPCINTLAQGAISFIVIDGNGNASEPKTVRAPYTFISDAETRKVLVVHEECMFINSILIPEGVTLDPEDDEDIKNKLSIKDDYIEGEIL